MTLATIPKPSKQQVVDWIVAAWRELWQRPELVQKSFKVCGISDALDGSEDEMVQCGKYISETLAPEPQDDVDPFMLIPLKNWTEQSCINIFIIHLTLSL